MADEMDLTEMDLTQPDVADDLVTKIRVHSASTGKVCTLFDLHLNKDLPQVLLQTKLPVVRKHLEAQFPDLLKRDYRNGCAFLRENEPLEEGAVVEVNTRLEQIVPNDSLVKFSKREQDFVSIMVEHAYEDFEPPSSSTAELKGGRKGLAPVEPGGGKANKKRDADPDAADEPKAKKKSSGGKKKDKTKDKENYMDAAKPANLTVAGLTIDIRDDSWPRDFEPRFMLRVLEVFLAAKAKNEEPPLCEDIDKLLTDEGFTGSKGKKWAGDGCVVMRALFNNGLWPESESKAVLAKRQKMEDKFDEQEPRQAASAAEPSVAASEVDEI